MLLCTFLLFNKTPRILFLYQGNSQNAFQQLDFFDPGVQLALPSSIEARASRLERRYYFVVNFVLYFAPRIDCRKDV